MELDESVGEAHDTLGTLKQAFDWDWEGAEREDDRALALAPSYSCAHEGRAGLLAFLGRRDEALAELAKIDLGVGYEGMGKAQKAISEYQRAVEISGGDSKSVVALAHAYAAAGRKAEAEKT